MFTAQASAAVVNDSISLQEVVVTGTRNATDVRHLPMTVTVVGREKLTQQNQTSVLPTGAAGGINLRGISGGAGHEESHRRSPHL